MTRAHTLTARYKFFLKNKKQVKKEKKFPFTATSRGDVALLSANRV